jgi:hypothetical protein
MHTSGCRPTKFRFADALQPFTIEWLGEPGAGAEIARNCSCYESRREASDSDREPADVQVCLLPGAFDLQKLIREAPTGYETPPTPQLYGANVFYYYGRGGGGVAYPDVYYFNVDGHALRIVFDGPYRDSNSPTDKTRAIEKVILSSFRTIPH